VGCGVECPSPAPWPSPGQTVAFRHCSLRLQQGFGLRPTCRAALLRSQPYCFCNLHPDLCPPDDPISLVFFARFTKQRTVPRSRRHHKSGYILLEAWAVEQALDPSLSQTPSLG
jgi:hypothetical protein